jgi:hypothetical protein
LFDYLETSGHVGVNTENDYASNGWQRCTPLQCVLTPSSNSFLSLWCCFISYQLIHCLPEFDLNTSDGLTLLQSAE